MPDFHFDTNERFVICNARILGIKHSSYLRLALDTGATTTTISFKIARKIGALPHLLRHNTIITSIWGRETSPTIIVPKFSCLGITRKKFEILCHDLPPGSSIDGLLGLNFFKNTNLNIDFPKGTISIN